MQVRIKADKIGGSRSSGNMGLAGGGMVYMFRETPGCSSEVHIEVAGIQASTGFEFSAFKTDWVDLRGDENEPARWLANLSRKKAEGKFDVRLKAEFTGQLCPVRCTVGLEITLFRDKNAKGETILDRSEVVVRGTFFSNPSFLGKVYTYSIRNQ